MILPLLAEHQGSRCTIGALSNKLGSYLHVGTVSTLTPDGRRAADTAPHTASVEAVQKLLGKHRLRHALKTHAYEQAMTLAESTKVPEAMRFLSKAKADQIDEEQGNQLVAAIKHLKVKHHEVSTNDVPWLLAYAEMLEADDGVEQEEDEYDA